MDGMHYDHNYIYNTGDDDYSASFHWELPPTPSIIQLSISSYYEFDDEAHVQQGIRRVEFLDGQGVPRHTDFNPIPELPTAASVDRLTRVDWEIKVANCWADWLLNVFFWARVS